MNGKVSKIIVTGDVLRQRATGGSSQNENILWLFHQVRSALSFASGLVATPLLSGHPDCLGARLFAAHRLPVSFESWVRLHDHKPCVRDQAIIWEKFHDALVIAFELPEYVRKTLDSLRIPYIDLTIHPARFLDDLALGLRSNVNDLAEALEPHILYDEEIYLAASQAQSTLAKIRRLEECLTSSSIAVFAGQTTDDKVLIRRGRLLGAEDFLEEFADICRSHERILVKPHPYSPDNPVVVAFTRLFRNASVTAANFYHLLSHDAVTHVYSLTSSTSIEASYFGKHGVHLSRYPYHFSSNSNDGGRYLAIHPDIHLPQFWQRVLDKLGIETKPLRALRTIHTRSRLRQTLRSYWGAKIFEEAA